jgi:hypothetical protein
VQQTGECASPQVARAVAPRRGRLRPCRHPRRSDGTRKSAHVGQNRCGRRGAPPIVRSPAKLRCPSASTARMPRSGATPGWFGSLRLRVNGQRPLVEQFGLGIAALGLVNQGEVVEEVPLLVWLRRVVMARVQRRYLAPLLSPVCHSSLFRPRRSLVHQKNRCNLITCGLVYAYSSAAERRS